MFQNIIDRNFELNYNTIREHALYKELPPNLKFKLNRELLKKERRFFHHLFHR